MVSAICISHALKPGVTSCIRTKREKRNSSNSFCVRYRINYSFDIYYILYYTRFVIKKLCLSEKDMLFRFAISQKIRLP